TGPARAGSAIKRVIPVESDVAASASLTITTHLRTGHVETTHRAPLGPGRPVSGSHLFRARAYPRSRRPASASVGQRRPGGGRRRRGAAGGGGWGRVAAGGGGWRGAAPVRTLLPAGPTSGAFHERAVQRHGQSDSGDTWTHARGRCPRRVSVGYAQSRAVPQV